MESRPSLHEAADPDAVLPPDFSSFPSMIERRGLTMNLSLPTGSRMTNPPILTVAAVIEDDEGRVLLVRKRDSAIFIQPGGKREPDEAPLATLARELVEELGVELIADSSHRLGEFEDIAVNEPGRRVRAEAFVVSVQGMPVPAAEIEELRWIMPAGDPVVPVAPLSADHILPAFVEHRRRQSRVRA